MIEALTQYFENHISLEQDEKDYLKKHIQIKHIKKNAILLSEGEVSKAFYFVLKGGVRLFYLNETDEKTAFFYFENTFVSAYESFVRQVPAEQNLQTIEDSILAEITFNFAYQLIERFPKFEFLARVMMEEELIIYQKIISSFVRHNAEERYLQLLHDSSPILNRIPQHQLATYLGVTAETLSRIRKRIVSKDIS